MPFKYQVFDLAPQHNDVVWVYRDGALHRCWQHSTGGPVCAAAAFLTAAEARELLHTKTGDSPAARWPPDIVPPNRSPDRQGDGSVWKRGDGPIPPAP